MKTATSWPNARMCWPMMCWWAQESAPFRLRFDTGRPSTAVRYELHAAARAAEFALADFFGGDRFLIGEDQAFYNDNGGADHHRAGAERNPGSWRAM